MLFWSMGLGGLALAIMAVALAVSVSRAERRARRGLYRGLGLAEDTLELLMARNRDVLSELALVRLEPAAAQAEAEVEPPRPQPTIRLVHPVEGHERTTGSTPRSPPADRHRGA